jgi:curli biogenesis system outer membrane secretion channel CsgG
MMKRLYYFLFLVLFLTSIGTSPAFSQLKGLMKRIAVVNFEDRSGYGWHNLGAGLADMLVTELVKQGTYKVMERAELEKVMQEQQLGASGAVTPESAAKIGQLLGVELMVTGSVSEFGTKESGTNVGGGLLGGIGGGFKKQSARVVVDIRLVNTTSAEIVTAETATGEESSTSISVYTPEIDFSNPKSWDDTIQGKAARKAITQCVNIIGTAMNKLPWAGKILKVNDDGSVMMKPGSEGGVKEGMEFDVFSKGQPVVDPDTGESMGSEETKVGSIKVIKDLPGGKACRASITSGKGFAAGNLIKEKK